MHPSQMQIFRLPFAPDGSGFGALELGLQLVQSSPTGDVPLPLSGVEGKAKQDVLLFQAPYFSPGQTKAQLFGYLNPNFSTPDAWDSITQDPVPCDILMHPQAAADGTQFAGGAVLKQCGVKISDVMIEWDTDPPAFKQNGRIYVPADGKTQFTLICRAKRLRPGGGIVPDDRTIEFTHKIFPGSFPEPVRTVFFIDQQPQQGSRQDRTVWGSLMALPNAQRQDITLPGECQIRVRAWSPKGTIVRHEWAIAPGTAVRKDQIFVPVVLVEPKMSIEVVEPQMPVPATGDTYKVTFQCFQELPAAGGGVDKKPAADTELEWEKIPAAPRIESEAIPTSGTTDSEGKITFDYTPAELFYYPGGRYYEDFRVFSGKGPRRSEIGKFRVYLAPVFKFRIGGKKDGKVGELELGFKFEEEEVTIGADEFVRTLQAPFAIEETNPVNGQKKQFPIAHAEVHLQFFNGKEYVPLTKPGQNPPLTDVKGMFALKPPELNEHYSDPKRRAGQDYTLTEDYRELPEISLNDAAQEEVKQYEGKVDQYYPDDVLAQDVTAKVKSYRMVFVEHLAALETRVYDVALSGIRLMRTAACYAKLFYDIYAAQCGRVWDLLKGFVTDLVSMLWNMLDVAGKVVGWVAGFVKSGLQAAQSWISTKMLPWVLNQTLPRLSAMGQALLDLIEQAISKMGAHAGWFTEAFRNFKNAVMVFLGQWQVNVIDWDNIGQFIMQGLRMAVHALGVMLAIVFGVVCRLGVALVQAIGGLVIRVTPAMVQAFLREVTAALNTKLLGPLGTTLEKGFDALAAWVAGEVWEGGIEPAIDRRAANSWIAQKLNIFPYACNAALACDYDTARKLQAPADFEPRIVEIRDFTTAVRDAWRGQEQLNIYIDEAKDLLDIGCTLVQVGLACLCAFAPALAPVAAAEIGQIETQWIAFKMVCIGLPQFTYNIGLAIGWTLGTNYELYTFMTP